MIICERLLFKMGQKNFAGKFLFRLILGVSCISIRDKHQKNVSLENEKNVHYFLIGGVALFL